MEIAEPVKQIAHEIEERARPQIDESTRRLTSLHNRVTIYIRANPGKSLLGAVAVGYIIGRIARRK